MSDNISASSKQAAAELFFAVQRAVASKYPESSEEVQREAALAILSKCGATFAPGGDLIFAPAVVASVAARLVQTGVQGNSEDARLARAALQTSQLEGLRPQRVTDVRAALAAIAPLSETATVDERCMRAILVTKALHDAGIAMEDPDGD